MKRLKEPRFRIPPEFKTPLEFMMAVINDPTLPAERRDAMAIAAAPYVHPKATRERAAAEVGKKRKQAEAAQVAGIGTSWDADLQFEDRAN